MELRGLETPTAQNPLQTALVEGVLHIREAGTRCCLECLLIQITLLFYDSTVSRFWFVFFWVGVGVFLVDWLVGVFLGFFFLSISKIQLKHLVFISRS